MFMTLSSIREDFPAPGEWEGRWERRSMRNEKRKGNTTFAFKVSVHSHAKIAL